MSDIIELVESENIDENLKRYILYFLNLKQINEQEYVNFIHNVKGRISSHIFKKINKFIKTKSINEELTTPGPKYRNIDIKYIGGKMELKRKLNAISKKTNLRVIMSQ